MTDKTMASDVARIAAGLSEAQRKAVWETTQPRDYAEVNGHTRLTLFRKGIFTSVASKGLDFYLTETGLAVRAHLKEPTP